MPVWRRRGKSRRKRNPWIVDYVDLNGKRHRKSAATQEAAEAMLPKLRNERPSTGNPDMTIAEYAVQWQRQLALIVKPATLRGYDGQYRTHIGPAFGGVKFKHLSRPMVNELLLTKREAGLSKGTVRFMRASLSSLLSCAIADELVAENVALAGPGQQGRKTVDATTEVERQKNIRPFEPAEVATLLAATRDHEERTVLMVMARTGMRPSECVALQWDDIDFSKNTILITRALSEKQIGSPKTGVSRSVDVSTDLAKALGALYAQRQREKLAGRWDEIPAWVFPCRRHNSPCINQDDARKIFGRAMRRARMGGHVLYDLRHTFATTLLSRGVPLAYVSKQLGHKKQRTTLDHYSHWITSGSDRRFVNTLDDHPAELGTTSGTTHEENVA